MILSNYLNYILSFIIILAISDSLVLPACKILETQTQTCADKDLIIQNKRIVSIGDVHGSYEGLLEVLFKSNITISDTQCEWKQQENAGTILIQMGDIVDRGPGALESFLCLKKLQEEANNFGSNVIRLIGSNN